MQFRRITCAALVLTTLTACTGSGEKITSVASGSPVPSFSPSPTRSPFTERATFEITQEPTELPLYPLVYRFDPDEWVGRTGFRRARDGAVEINYGRRYGGKVGWAFNPVSTAQFCLTAYNEYAIDEKPAHREYAIKAAESMLRRAEKTDAGILWRYSFPNTTYNAPPGWISGMAQGMGAACLAAAYKMTGNESLLAGARRAHGVLVAPFGPSGTAARVAGGVFYEEIAARGIGPSHTLNGMIFALAGIDFLDRVEPRPDVRKALDAGVRGVASLLQEFDVPGMSLYDLGHSRPAGPGRYNRTHLAQMIWLAEISGDTRFLEAALRFSTHERNVPYKVTSSLAASGSNTPDHMTRYGGTYEIPRGKTATLTLRLLQASDVDEIILFSAGRLERPAKVEIAGGAVTYDAQRVRVALDAKKASTLTIDVTASRSSPARIDLLTLSNEATRSIAAITSDLGVTGRSHYAVDGKADSFWKTTHADAWLLFMLPEGTRSVRLTMCPGSVPSVSFGANLTTWTKPAEATAEMPAPAGTRFALLRWAKNGCFADLAAQP